MTVGVAPTVARRLREVSHEHDATTFVGLLAAFFGVLTRHVRATDLTVGIPINLRDRPELEDLVGMLVNTVVISAIPSTEPTLTGGLHPIPPLPAAGAGRTSSGPDLAGGTPTGLLRPCVLIAPTGSTSTGTPAR
jgi:hypothetical protein